MTRKEIVFKRIGKVILIFALIVLCYFVCFFAFRSSFQKSAVKSANRLDHFSKYRSDFQMLAWKARELYQEAKEGSGDDLKKLIIMEAVDHEWKVTRHFKSDPKSETIIQMTPNDPEKKAYASVLDFSRENRAAFYGIRVTDKCVIFTFGKENITAVCYGFRPPEMEKGREYRENIYVDVLALHWYQMFFD